MQINNIESFLGYYSKIKNRTQRLFDYIPPDKLEWTYLQGKFTIGDIIRHLANIERYMYAETVQFKPSKYKGCGIEFAKGFEEVKAYYNRMHEESMQIFARLSTKDLQKKCNTPAGIEITIWKWLRAMVEHEVHHRGQLYMYLGMLDVKTPPIFGLTSEEVASNSK
ncbi:DinB family protein [Aquimarina gracilis]|uniref:DinB family protein n=1 Tax=Aquimarina gracilis TaxID=874422 RepID=A0ABU5ZVC1_9FLAO|nr:DinB family protein [Aquimarina gracilis]MEB3345738.1 DinB family protein [Aquimarina gracilis]